jgi:hypothetical protein
MMAFTVHATGQVLTRNADFVKWVLKLTVEAKKPMTGSAIGVSGQLRALRA